MLKETVGEVLNKREELVREVLGDALDNIAKLEEVIELKDAIISVQEEQIESLRAQLACFIPEYAND